jgi:uncharacterized MAPEG superfamily protein
MNTVILTVLIACLLPIILAWVAGYYRHQQLGTVDNKHPREQVKQLTGAGARTVAAQLNAWEALIVYVAALWAVTTAGISLSTISTVCLGFIACRILHAIFYMINQDILRSLAFVGSYGICIYLFVLAL